MLQLDIESNALLRSLGGASVSRLGFCIEVIDLPRNKVLHDAGRRVERVYFPLDGLVAILSETLAGDCVQSGMIGCDGAVGALEALGSGQYLSRGVVQIAGTAARISAGGFRELLRRYPSFESALDRYSERVLAEARQLVVCNALHSAESRLARSILQVLDRSCLGGALPLTQEGFAQMLGAQRTTVAALLARLQARGLIARGRAHLEVRDRSGLERIACSCQATLKAYEYEAETFIVAHSSVARSHWQGAGD